MKPVAVAQGQGFHYDYTMPRTHYACSIIYAILAWPWLLAALGPWKHGCAFCNVAPAALCFLPFAMWGVSSASPPIGLLPRCFVLQRAQCAWLHF